MPQTSRHSTRPPRTLVRALLLLGALGGVLTAVPAGPASAAPIDDLRAQAAQIEGQMSELGANLGMLHEQIKYSQEQIDEAMQTVADAEAGIESAQAYVVGITALVRQRAATVYRKAGLTGVGEFDTDIRQQASRRKYASATNQRDDHLLNKLARAKEDLASRREAAEKQHAVVQEHQGVLKAQEAEFASRQAELAALEAGVKGEIAVLVAEEQARRRAAEAAVVARGSASSGGGTTFDPSTVPPASGQAGIAVGYALAQVGKPYCNDGGRKGPDCYDCSGLTQQAWAAAGVSIPGSSGSQHSAFPKVPMDQIKPGDLLFFPNPGAHVGIYVGGSSVVSASVPGDFVKYHPLSYYTSAVRPG